MHDKSEALAFRLLHEVSEKLKDEGLDKDETWAVMFDQLQNLMAADFGTFSTEHMAHVEAQRDCLDEWFRPIADDGFGPIMGKA